MAINIYIDKGGHSALEKWNKEHTDTVLYYATDEFRFFNKFVLIFENAYKAFCEVKKQGYKIQTKNNRRLTLLASAAGESVFDVGRAAAGALVDRPGAVRQRRATVSADRLLVFPIRQTNVAADDRQLRAVFVFRREWACADG